MYNKKYLVKGDQTGWEFGNSREVYTGIRESKRELLQHSSSTNVRNPPKPIACQLWSKTNLYSLLSGIISMCIIMYPFRYHYGPYWYFFGPFQCLFSPFWCLFGPFQSLSVLFSVYSYLPLQAIHAKSASSSKGFRSLCNDTILLPSMAASRRGLKPPTEPQWL